MRFLPPWVFRLLGVGLLCGAICLPFYWAWADAGLYRWFESLFPSAPALLALLLSMLICLLGVLLAILALRQLTVGQLGLADEVDAARRLAAGDRTDVERLLGSKSFARTIGPAFAVIGTLLIGLTVRFALTDRGLRMRLGVAGIVFLGFGLWSTVRGRVPRR